MILATHELGLRVAGRILCQDISLQIEPGQVWFVIGRNGAGKTTLIRALAGLQEPNSGNVTLDGVKLKEWGRRRLAQMRGYLPQHIEDHFPSTVLETVLAGRFPHQGQRLRDRWSFASDADLACANACLRDLDLISLATRRTNTLSGGERQRVAFAGLLAQEPAVALLDEPTAHLDLDTQSLVMKLLVERIGARSCPAAAVVSAHDINLAERYATHVILFGRNATVVAGAKGEILKEGRLTASLGHRVRELVDGTQRWFVAD